MRTLILTVAILAFLHSSCSDHRTDTRPNLLLILADDMGYSDPGCFGSEINTPNLDRLAGEGLRMTQFYNAGRCCPTRASLLTGLYQHQAGIGSMEQDFGIPAYQGYLNSSCVTLAEALKLAGYNTYMSGKWHVGNEEAFWPRKRGFDRYFGLIDGASSYFNLDPYRVNQRPRKMALDDDPYDPPEEGFYMTDAFTDYAISFLEEETSKPEPFFLYLPYTAPHWPLHALPGDIGKYRGNYLDGWDSLRVRRYENMIDLGIIDEQWVLSPRFEIVEPWNEVPQQDRDMWDLRMAVYAAMIDRMDQNIGRVLEQLESMGEKDNTLIIFIADNGGCHEWIKNVGNYLPTEGITGTPESFDAYQHHWANVSNTPFRWFKHWVHEGGISSPFIARYPPLIEAGRIDHRPGHIIDIMPTFLELAGAGYPARYKGKQIKEMEGTSLVPLLTNTACNWERTLFWEHHGNRAVRQGNWKLVSRFDQRGTREYTPWELYRLDSDRSEMHDLGGEEPEKLKEMVRLYEKTASRVEVTEWKEVLEIRNR